MNIDTNYLRYGVRYLERVKKKMLVKGDKCCDNKPKVLDLNMFVMDGSRHIVRGLLRSC
jgi:hypothetical protein